MALQSRDIGFHGRGTSLALIAIIFTSIALATVIGRFYYRSTNGRRMGKDDAVIAFSMVREHRVLAFERCIC